MKAARFYNAKDIRVEEVDRASVGPNDVLLKVAWAGICGSDLHEYNAGPLNIPGDKPDPLTGQVKPITMGHEFSGIVEEVGPDVQDIEVGDKIAVNPMILSGKHGGGLIDMYQGGSTIGLAQDGGFAEYAVFDAKHAYKLNKDTNLKLGALVEPIAVAMQAIRESELQFGESVAIFGVGPIGLALIMAARVAGAREIFAFDLSDKRLEKAKELGATHTINSGNQDPVEYIKQYYPYGVDRTFEVAGVDVVFKQAIRATRPRGMVNVVSIYETGIEFNPMWLTISGVHISTSLGYEDDIFELTINMIESGQLDPWPLITDQIELDNIVKDGFEQLQNDKSQAKILVQLSGEE
ncbi:Sorbitol dehydrogenase [Alloiococcus otitis]|uniref:Enoyl reductase (ER) domain-containing protein n=1 Tax=Alloiococcus otitis ATCC 51267 TaxID=883081 RepID=K9ECQ8_9LACT|nr:2,3-butanediol dehydrogenase [Alloiococcus otitis]EKU93646.1 hypothetical protein HMPREF9698_00763 [Alloiococcus otitis ATCC 51267]SUU80243.1 Sorbitol dehydrogenase [Alloiococcus otitis]